MAENEPNRHGNSQSELTFPFHLCFFFLILLMFLSFSWYSNYESALEGLFEQFKVALMASPLLLLLILHCLSTVENPRILNLIPATESFFGAGETPWGVGFVVVLLLFMVSYRSYFQELWFPLLSR